MPSIDYLTDVRIADYFSPDLSRCRAQVVFDVDPKLAAELADAKFAFVTRPTSEGEQDVVDDETPTDNTDTGGEGGEGGGDNNGGGGLE